MNWDTLPTLAKLVVRGWRRRVYYQCNHWSVFPVKYCSVLRQQEATDVCCSLGEEGRWHLLLASKVRSIKCPTLLFMPHSLQLVLLLEWMSSQQQLSSAAAGRHHHYYTLLRNTRTLSVSPPCVEWMDNNKMWRLTYYHTIFSRDKWFSISQEQQFSWVVCPPHKSPQLNRNQWVFSWKLDTQSKSSF